MNRPRVLIVDDEPMNRRVIAAMLGPENVEPIEAGSGEEALASIAGHRPDLVLLDVMMPGTDGFVVAGRLKADAATRNIPIILVTALDDRDSRLRGLGVGAEDFLTKPVDRAELVVRVRNLLRLKAWADAQEELGQRAQATSVALEQRLVEAHRMEAMGRLAGALGHDFNNLLSLILGYGDLLAASMPDDDPRRADLEEIRVAARKGADLTRQLMSFGYQNRFRPVDVDVGALLSAMEQRIRGVVGDAITLDMTAVHVATPVVIDPGQLEELVINLVSNARDAMADGGALSLASGDVSLDEDWAARHPDAAAGTYVQLTVRDTGVGMEPAVVAQMFEPFFTTRPSGHGAGLGLSTVRGIVRDAGGAIDVDSAVGAGTTVRVYLPTSRAADLRGHETILLVETDERVRVGACTSLRALGYNVLEAESPGDAFFLCDDGVTVHLLVTADVMPHVSGQALAARLAPNRPEMLVLYLTEGGTFPEGTPVVQKPFTPDGLARAVRAAIDRGPLSSVKTKFIF